MGCSIKHPMTVLGGCLDEHYVYLFFVSETCFGIKSKEINSKTTHI